MLPAVLDASRKGCSGRSGNSLSGKDPVASLSLFAQEKATGFWFLDSSKLLLCVASVVLCASVVIAVRGRFTTETRRVH